MARGDREDMSGRVCIVTGANTGIGKEIARGLALMRARVVLACRSAEKGKAAVDEIVADTFNERVELMVLDTSSQRSIRAFAEEFLAKHDKLHVLVNNAGIWPEKREVSVDNIELTWATNVLGYHLLTALLLDRLKASAPARIINIASDMAYGLELDDVQFTRRPFNGVTAYAQSKQANRMLTWGLERRLEGSRVTANAVHPGMVASDITRSAGGGLFRAIAGFTFRLAGKTPEAGADTAVWLASSDEVERSTGNFYVKRKIKRCKHRDEAKIEALWKLCDEMTGLAR